MARPDDGNEAQLDTTMQARRTGAMLGEARAAAGIELADIARDTRVPLRHLRAIEDDAHDALPALPYAIGFVKSFARAVGLDGEAVAAQFRAETTKTPHVPSVATIEPLDERRMPARGLVLTSVAAVLLIIGGLSAWGAGLFDAPPPPAPAAAVSAGSGPQSGDAALAAGEPGAALPAGPAASSPTPAGGVDPAAPATGGGVVLTAREEVWVKISDKVTRTTAKIGVLKAGESYALPAGQPGLVLWTGKAGALAVTVGGRAIPPLGGPVQTIRGVSLAPADLLARAAAAPAAGPAAPVPIAQPPGMPPGPLPAAPGAPR